MPIILKRCAFYMTDCGVINSASSSGAVLQELMLQLLSHYWRIVSAYTYVTGAARNSESALRRDRFRRVLVKPDRMSGASTRGHGYQSFFPVDYLRDSLGGQPGGEDVFHSIHSPMPNL